MNFARKSDDPTRHMRRMEYFLLSVINEGVTCIRCFEEHFEDSRREYGSSYSLVPRTVVDAHDCHLFRIIIIEIQLAHLRRKLKFFLLSVTFRRFRYTFRG